MGPSEAPIREALVKALMECERAGNVHWQRRDDTLRQEIHGGQVSIPTTPDRYFLAWSWLLKPKAERQ